MRKVRLQATAFGYSADEAYRVLADFSRYPEHSEAVRSVTVTEVDRDISTSSWEVTFRSGILRWTEEDRFDPIQHRIDFCQFDGDIALFEGFWISVDTPEGCIITFTACLDMGMPTLADVLEPIAVNILLDNTASILQGLFGEGLRIETSTAESLTDPKAIIDQAAGNP
jgi:ribosome-associated toxin RatA of RatAB toxin-antitoxin module